MNIFDELLHRLSSKTRIRQLLKDVKAPELERILSRIKDTLKEKQLARDNEDAHRQLKIQSIEAIKQIMADRGVSMGDLGLGGESTPRRRRNTQKYTFQYETNTGDSSSWEGATTGRLPRDFQTYLERTGKKRMDCVIENKDEA
ncbi:MAG: H-NS family nucleoid-associated regulatory protein [Candidatus Endonucleobacter sp. (ex Gigantidas childressi)]|nr:H-NS family nucleoid-associated regulatory protein [Candidatus Endonucleobacter sp. (ex Gigantidas childressi)]